MNVLVIGSGGREHAICHSFRTSDRIDRLFCANGNAGIAGIAECVDVQPDNIAGLVRFAEENSVDLTFVGGETPLALGIVDEFETRGLRIIGPERKAARLEASKGFAKDFMARHNVPTAKSITVDAPSEAVSVLESGFFGDTDTPVVVKADGLAAGKGVVVAADRKDAVTAVNEMAARVGSAASGKIVLEECLVGKEVSLLMFADGEDFALMPPTRDHKRIGEGDTGPNTGGMGAITDDLLLADAELSQIVETMIRPTLSGCLHEDMRFRGVLFLGLMLTTDGPKLLEYNVRFGDPETQAILVRLETDLVVICERMLEGTLSGLNIEWAAGNSACVVMAASGYPSKPKVGDPICGVATASSVPGVTVFHAGTAPAAASPGDVLYSTSGGRVLGVTARGTDLARALEAAYRAVEHISFDGMQYRRDIGTSG